MIIGFFFQLLKFGKFAAMIIVHFHLNLVFYAQGLGALRKIGWGYAARFPKPLLYLRP